MNIDITKKKLTQMTIHIDEIVKNIELLMHINKIKNGAKPYTGH